MKKFSIVLIAALLVAALVLFLGKNILLRVVANRATAYTSHLLTKKKALKLSKSRFKSIQLIDGGMVEIQGFSTAVVPVKKDDFSEPSVVLQVGEACLFFKDSKLFVRVNELGVVFSETGPGGTAKKTRGEFSGASGIVALPIDLAGPWRLKASLKRLIHDVGEAIKIGSTELQFEVSGKLRFTIEGQTYEGNVVTQTINGKNYFVLDRVDVRQISEALDQKLTESEIDFIARHPIQASRLFRIKNYAVKRSQEAHRKDPAIPEDAYRHVLWSYLLTKKFGPEFAKTVTDAHEVGDRDEDNTEADHRMDYNNNAVGRRYATKGVEENRILSFVISDTAVIRAPISEGHPAAMETKI